MKYKSLTIIAWLAWGQAGYYEVHGKTESGEINRLKLPFIHCREKKLIRRYDHTKKIQDFLNTDDGQKWLDSVAN